MTGLDLEQFLRLLKNDPSLWLSLGGGVGLVALIIWAGRGKRRVLQRCLLLSLLLHTGLVVYGGPQAVRWLSDPADLANTLSLKPERRASDSRVQLLSDQPAADKSKLPESRDPRGAMLASALDSMPDLPAMDEPNRAPRPRRPLDAIAPQVRLADPPEPLAQIEPTQPATPEMAFDAARPSMLPPVMLPEPVALAELSSPSLDVESQPPMASAAVAVPEADFGSRMRVAARAPSGFAPGLDSLISEPMRAPSGAVSELPPEVAATDRDVIFEPASGSATGLIDPDNDVRAKTSGASLAESEPLSLPEVGPRRPVGRSPSVNAPLLAMGPDRRRPVPLEIRPIAPEAVGVAPSIPMAGPPPAGRPLPEIPSVYRSRFAPNRSALALRAGATPASEESVGLALAWLARHQDADGRWNAGSRPGPNGRPGPGESSFLAHCPPGELCSGESEYWGADNAMTGLALLAFLGAGHTQEAGPYAANIRRGLNFLLGVQGADGDLRGPSRGYGIYCHAIATLALCEAYALTDDKRLRSPVERAIRFLVDARAADRLSWRYEPGDRFGGDTSILGWAVMVAKSAREIGLNVPEDVRRGATTWLARVSEGKARGLAMYRPPGYSDGGRVTPTMTAEAWVCRQFLGSGGPGPASDEAAAYLLTHGPDRDPFNLYYWYYATLAMYQHGGPAWTRWNARVRDQLVSRQVRSGHAEGSWDPALCKDPYDSKGGRIYATALAALTLEVYYRYLKLYDAPPEAEPSEAAAVDSAIRRSSPDSPTQ